MTKRTDRDYRQPYYSLSLVISLAHAREIVLTGRAATGAVNVFPGDLIDLDYELREIVKSLVINEFQFAQRKSGIYGNVSWVDVYRVDFEDCDVWLKLKTEQDETGDYVVIISCHEWDESIPI